MKTHFELAKECALKGGEILRKGFSRNKDIEFKGFGDPVTQFDKASEKAIVETILEKFPNHAILTEEELSTVTDSDYRWIIDPLDGTVNFTHRVPLIAVSIGLEYKGEIILGIIYNPILDEMYYAEKGKGAFLNGEPIHVSGTSEPGHSMIVTGFPYNEHMKDRVEEVVNTMRTIVRDYQAFRRFGSAAIDMAYVACGICEAFYEEDLKPWDTAAGSIIVSEAGGRVSDYYGEPYSINAPTILADNGEIHSRMVEELSKVKSPPQRLNF